MVKDFEQLFSEAKRKAAAYSQQWDGLYESDPGLTMLEYLTAFHLLQDEAAGEISDRSRWGLFQLLGMESRPPQPARVYVCRAGEGPALYLPRHQKFRAGGLCFETDREVAGLIGSRPSVYSKKDGVMSELPELRKGVPLSARLFGAHPGKGDSVYLRFQTLPREKNAKILLYIKAAQTHDRNPFAEEEALQFAKLQWSCLTGTGYKDIPFLDATHGFLESGIVELTIDGTALARQSAAGEEECWLRCTLVEAAYDMAPAVTAVYGPLLLLWQTDTQSFCKYFSGEETIHLWELMESEMFVNVYVREEGGGDYYEYKEQKGAAAETGRYYHKTVNRGQGVQLAFSKERYGFAPAAEADAVLIISCSEQLMIQRELGIIYGYDEQEFSLDAFPDIVGASLWVGAAYIDKQGQKRYCFFHPEDLSEDAICYSYDSGRNAIIIHEPGSYTGSSLFIAGCAISVWDEGNIRQNNLFLSSAGKAGIQMINPLPGFGGRKKESLDEAAARLQLDLQQPLSAVTKEDYEFLVQRIPGLCIHKVSAYYDSRREAMCVVVKPHSSEPFPELSPLYHQCITRHLEERKLLTERFVILDPTYIRVDVVVSVGVTGSRMHKEEMIEKAVCRELDGGSNDSRIGADISFQRISDAVLLVPGVNRIYQMEIMPRTGAAEQVFPGQDIPIIKSGLCYPGKIIIKMGK